MEARATHPEEHVRCRRCDLPHQCSSGEDLGEPTHGLRKDGDGPAPPARGGSG